MGDGVADVYRKRIASIATEFEIEYLVIGGGAKRPEGVQDGDYERLAEGLGRVTDIADQHGMSAHYHPHLTTSGEAPAEVARVFSLSPINFCPDMAHLAAAGGDPAQMIREHADRIKYVHLKDLRCDPFAFLPLGEGELDMSAILEALAEGLPVGAFARKGAYEKLVEREQDLGVGARRRFGLR